MVAVGGLTSTKVGSLERHWARLAEMPGIELFLFENSYSKVPEPVLKMLSASGVTVYQHDLPARPSFGLVSTLARVFRELRPDIVHVNFGPACYLAMLAARFGGNCRVVWTIHSRVRIRMLSRSWLLHALAIHNADAVICVSRGIRNDLQVAHLGSRKEVVIALGVDTSIYSPPTQEESTKARRSLGIPESCFVITMVAEARPEKNTGMLIRAISRCTHEPWFGDCLVLLVGGGVEEAANRQLAHDLGVVDHVQFLGISNDVHTLYAATDVAGLTSLSEGLGLSLLEASAMAIPVFGPNVGGVPEVIDEGKTGFLFPPDDNIALSHILMVLASDVTLRQRMGNRGREKILETFASNVCLRRLVNLYRLLVNEGRGESVQ